MTEVKRNTVRTLIADAMPKIDCFEAFILLAHILDKPKEYLIAHDDDELSDTTVMTFDMFVSMRLDGMPVPYLTGHQDFFGRYFAVDPNVLIPQPDTEVLIEQSLNGDARATENSRHGYGKWLYSHYDGQRMPWFTCNSHRFF